jgi:hypothetical protein
MEPGAVTLPAGVRRLPGWEARLHEVVEFARAHPYVLGQHDCVKVACFTIRMLTGIDLWTQWEGRYSTRREALVLIQQFAGAGFTEAFSKLFGVPTKHALAARRGDIVEFFDIQPHLGVCIGAEFAVLADSGLRFFSLERARHAWGIG